MALNKKLTKHGNSLALVIDRPILDLLNIDEQTNLTISTDGQVLVISPTQSKARKKQFEKALANTNQKYGKMLKRLAS